MKYKTNAAMAEEYVNRETNKLADIPQPWRYLDMNMSLIILESTIDEIVQYRSLEPYLRPGYKATNEGLRVPTLFAKVNYSSDQLDKITMKAPNTIIYTDKSIHHFIEESSFKSIDEKLRNLRPSYRAFIIESMASFISEADKITLLDGEEVGTILEESFLALDKNIIDLYNHIDFQFAVPKLIIHLKENVLSKEASLILTFLNYIGFDVIIINTRGFADIENYVNKHQLNIYLKPYQPHQIKRLSWTKVVTSIAVILLIIALSLYGFQSFDRPLADNRDIIVSTGQTVTDDQVDDEETNKKAKITGIQYSNQPIVGDDFADVNAVVIPTEQYVIYRAWEEKQVDLRTNIESTGNTAHLESEHITYFDGTDNKKIRSDFLPNIYTYTAYTKMDTYRYVYRKKLFIDGSKELQKLQLGQYLNINIIRAGINNDMAKIAAFDEYGNELRPQFGDLGEMSDMYMRFRVQNLDTNEVLTKDIAYSSNRLMLPDGNYRFNYQAFFYEPEVTYNFVNNQIRVEDGKIYYIAEKNQAPVLKEKSIKVKCKLGDILIIDLSQFVEDEDEDFLYYDDGIISNSYTKNEGIDGSYYYLYAEKTGERNRVIEITDMKSDEVSLILSVEITE